MTNEIDQIIHQPIRTKIMVLLLSQGKCDYTTIKNTLNISDGHMSTHMKVLVSEDYVEMEKSFVDNKPKTTYCVTKRGRKKFNEYLESLKRIVEIKF